MEKGLGIEGYRAVHDQEEMIKKKIVPLKGVPRSKALILFIFGCALFTLGGSLHLLALSSGLTYAPEMFKISGIAKFMSKAVLAYSIIYFVSLTYKVKKLEKIHKNLWGNHGIPKMFYRYNKHLNEFRIYLSFPKRKNSVYIGTVDADDELAKISVNLTSERSDKSELWVRESISTR